MIGGSNPTILDSPIFLTENILLKNWAMLTNSLEEELDDKLISLNCVAIDHLVVDGATLRLRDR